MTSFRYPHNFYQSISPLPPPILFIYNTIGYSVGMLRKQTLWLLHTMPAVIPAGLCRVRLAVGITTEQVGITRPPALVVGSIRAVVTATKNATCVYNTITRMPGANYPGSPCNPSDQDSGFVRQFRRRKYPPAADCRAAVIVCRLYTSCSKPDR